MIEEQPTGLGPQHLSNRPFFRQYPCQELRDVQTSSTIELKPMGQDIRKAKIPCFWPIEPKIVASKNSFYYITFSQPFINVYSVLPEVEKHNIVLNQFIPQDIHISNRTVYLLLSGGVLATFPLGKTEAKYEGIRQLEDAGKVYSMHTSLRGDGREGLKIGYQRGGLKYYEHQATESILGSIVGNFKLGGARYLSPVPPNNLLGFVVTDQNELKFVNLWTKQFVDCEPIQLQSKVHIDNIRLRFLTRVPSLRKKGYVVFIMCVFYVSGKACQLYQVTLKQSTPVQSGVDLDDFISGDIGQEGSIKPLVTLNIKGEIEDVTLGDQGLFVFYKKGYNFPILKCTYRALSQILKEQPVEMMESQIFKSHWQEKKVDSVQTLRERLLMPGRFNFGFISECIGNQNVYAKLEESNLQDTKMLMNRITTTYWPQTYRLIGLVNVQGTIFVVRKSSISILLRNSYGMENLERHYYESEVMPFEEPQELIKDISGLSSYHKVNRQMQSPKGPRQNIVDLHPETLKLTLMRVAGHSKEEGQFYKDLMIAFHRLIRLEEYQQVQFQNTCLNLMVRNTVLAQVCHTVKVLAVLAKRLYISSLQDYSSNDVDNIAVVGAVYKMLYSPLELFHTYFKDGLSRQYSTFNLLTCFVMQESRQGSSFSFGSFEDQDYLKIMNILFGGLVNLSKEGFTEDTLVSFNKSNQLMRFLVAETQKNTHLKPYLQIMTKHQPVQTNLTLLKALLLVGNDKEFSARALALAISPDFSCKLLTGLLPNNLNFRQGRAILQFLSLMFQQDLTSTSLQTRCPSQYLAIIKGLFRKCNQTELVQRYSQELGYLQGMNSRCLLNEFLNKKRLLELVETTRLSADPLQMYTLLLQILKRQCTLFNKLAQDQEYVESEEIRQLLCSMHVNVKGAIKNFAIAQGTAEYFYQQVETRLLTKFRPFIMGRMPTTALLDILSKAQSQYTEPRIIQFNSIPAYFMKQLLGNPDRMEQDILNLKMYFSEKEIVKALVANTNQNSLIKTKQATSALAYGMVDYYGSLKEAGKVNEVLRLIKNSEKFRSYQKQVTRMS